MSRAVERPPGWVMTLVGVLADAYGIAMIFYYFGFMLFLANLVIFIMPKDAH